MNTLDPEPFEFIRAVFKSGGRDYTYKAKPHTLAVGDLALNSNGKTVTVTAVKAEAVVVNGVPLADILYSWVTKKPVAPVNSEPTPS
jgi:hypothetical protein